MQISENCDSGTVRTRANLVDLENHCKMNIYSQNRTRYSLEQALRNVFYDAPWVGIVSDTVLLRPSSISAFSITQKKRSRLPPRRSGFGLSTSGRRTRPWRCLSPVGGVGFGRYARANISEGQISRVSTPVEARNPFAVAEMIIHKIHAHLHCSTFQRI